MIEIIPNWHPLFVHFTIGLVVVAAGLHVVTLFLSQANSAKAKIIIAANMNLWIGVVLTLFTVSAGWLAFQSVNHDTPSHIAMTDHRNWGIGTTAILVVTALLSYFHSRKHTDLSRIVIVLVIVASGLLLTTGWKGGELVYRHGIGVMSLPKLDTHDHASHDHAHTTLDDVTHEESDISQAHDHGDHDHAVTPQHSDESQTANSDDHHQHSESLQIQEESPPHNDGHDHKH